MFKRTICFLLLAVFIGSPLLATAKELTPVHQVEGISEYRLKNGLKVLLFPDQTKETVTVNVTYRVGSKHENYGETGMAHLLEHLLFKGSKKHKDIPAELSARGAKPNGTTWIDRTNYYETFAATPENIDWALSLESDRMVNSFIAKKDLDSEMTVVRNEFERSENSPFRVLMQRILLASYDWHNNGKPTIGARADIENVSIERLQAFYKTYYQPDNAVLTIAGKFDEKSLLKKIQKTFGKIKKPKRKLPVLYTEEPAADGEKSVTVRRVGDTQLYASAYHIPAGFHPDYPAIEVLSHVLGDTPRGRLHKNVVENKLAVGAYAFPFQLEAPGLLFFAAQVDMETELSKTRDAYIENIENIHAHPITQEELDTAKRSILKDYEQAFNSSETIAILLSEYVGMGDWRLLFLTRDRIEAVELADVQRVAEQYLVQNNRTEGTFIPTKTPERVVIPAAEPVAKMLAGYEGKKAVAQGEAFDPSFDNIKSRTDVHTLSNGAKVSLLPKKSRGEEVVVQFALNFGSQESLTGRRVAGGVAANMLLLGTQKYDRQTLQTEFDKIKTEVNIGGDVDGVRGSLTTKREFLKPALELLVHVLKNPSFDEKEFGLLVDKSLAGLESSRQDPQAIASREMKRLFNPYEPSHPKYVPTLDESIASLNALKLEDVKAFYQTFYGASHMEFSVVGDFDKKAVLSDVQALMGDWKSPQPYARMTNKYQAFPAVDKKFETPDKENAILIAKLALPVGETDKEAAALEMGMYIFGGGFLNSRLATRLRQKDGLSYGVGAWISFDALESRSELGMYAIFAPQNLSAVEAGIKEEVARVIKDGFTEKELSDAIAGYLQKRRVTRAQDQSLAGLLNSSQYLQRDILWHKSFEEAIRKLDVKTVNAAFAKYVNAEGLTMVKAGDFAGKQ